MSRGNKWVPLDQYLAQEFKTIRREFSMIEAMFSYTLDQDKGVVGTISGYAKLWGWSRNKTRRFINCIRTDGGHTRDSKRTHTGHPIHFIDRHLMGKKDSQRTVRGQSEDSQHDTTIHPNPKPKPNKNKKIVSKTYLKELIIENNFIEIRDLILDFFEYRMSMPSAKRYKTNAGLKILFKDLAGCRENGLIVSECIEEAIGRGWLTPKPEYFKKNSMKKQDGGEQWLAMRKAARARGEIQ